jgi:hypothetical protein
MEKKILKTPCLHQANVFTFVEPSFLLFHYINQYVNVSEADDVDSKRKKYLLAERERAAKVFEEECQQKKIKK